MFAPSMMIQDGNSKVNIQTYLQDAFLKAFERLIDAVGDVETVLGFEVSLIAEALDTDSDIADERASSRFHWTPDVD